MVIIFERFEKTRLLQVVADGLDSIVYIKVSVVK